MNTQTHSPPSNALLLIDADYLPHAYGGFYAHDAIEKVDAWFEKIFKACESRQAMVLLKKVPQDNFRYQVAITKPYKGNRERELPVSYDTIMEYLVHKYAGITIKYVETDDAIAQLARMLRNEGREYVIVSDDKDLNQIPGWHYKHSKEEWIRGDDLIFYRQTFKMKDGVPHYTSTLDATGEFKVWLQMIVGDTSDNISGVLGAGLKAAATNGFAPGITMADAKLIVWSMYIRAYPADYREKFLENYRLLKLINNSTKSNLVICPTNYQQPVY